MSMLVNPFFYEQVEDINLVRDEATGKSRGFCFLKYEDARSCVLAVDNLTGSKVRANSVYSSGNGRLMGVSFFTIAISIFVDPWTVHSR
jgi:RNA recognition motif-containing protein